MKHVVTLIIVACVSSGCIGERGPPPLPHSAEVRRITPEGFRYPGGLWVSSPAPGTVRATLSFDGGGCWKEPEVPSGSFEVRADTLTAQLVWHGGGGARSGEMCPGAVVRVGYEITMRGIKSGAYTFKLLGRTNPAMRVEVH